MQSASYSSTASALSTPRNTTHGIGGPSEAATDHSMTSPRSSSASTISSAYTTSLASAALSPSISHGRLSGSTHFPDPATLTVSAPSLAHAYAMPSSTPYQQASHEQINLSLGQLPMTSQPGRGSLDYSFIQASPSMANPHPGHAQPTPYPRAGMNPSKSQVSSKHDIR